ncbi:MAG TPA: phospho-N-acetylmuramoyl-pentapeptide-transferase, partial [Ruminococcaceae bacterium]|nr:phospho-N-acetylmuramoyl-pentapeptide-transferase [Oscillospiraceae bacterium]
RTAWQKTFLQLSVSAGYLIALALGGLNRTWIPFLGFVDVTVGAGLLFWPASLIFIYGFVNAVNLTDGVDGLASAVTMLVSAFFLLMAGFLEQYAGVSIVSAALAGGCVGFLIWNMHPAKVFMGDTGSMFLGGMAVSFAFAIDRPILLFLAGILYLIEALSVVLQVMYYKRTKKRLLKMSPLHHHFEMCGWKEEKIVLVFSVITVVGCLAGALLVMYVP